MRRRQPLDLSNAGISTLAQAASPEDTLLSKLSWYHAGGAVSEQKRHDLQGLVKVQGSALDRDYLQYWAKELGLSRLLDELLA